MERTYKIPAKSISVLSALAVAIPLTMMPTPSYAGAKDAIIGLGAGVLIGIGISNNRKKYRSNRNRNRGYNRTRRAKRANRATTIGAVNRTEVRQIQTALATLGYYNKKIDGDAGGGTKRAISSFQADRGFPLTGKLSANQKAMLFSSTGNGFANYQNPTNPAPYGQNYTGNNPNSEIDVFGNRTGGSTLFGQTPPKGAVFRNPAPEPAPAPIEQKKPAPNIDSRDLASVFDEQQPPDDSPEAVDPAN